MACRRRNTSQNKTTAASAFSLLVIKKNMTFKIDKDKIETSFDEIAKELLNNCELLVNDKIFEFTEIEFYYFNENKHQDKYTHKHDRDAGEWRFHNSGIDITFKGNGIYEYGGILIRGIKNEKHFINGPRNILTEIFKAFGNVTNVTKIQLMRKNSKSSYSIIKTFRHLPNENQYKEFHDKYYRYITHFEHLIISKKMKNLIDSKNEIL